MSLAPPQSHPQYGVTQLIYVLHGLSLLIGIVGTATIIGAFLFGWPSIIAVIINYVKRGDVRGTWLESHFDWQIKTFWYAVAASILIFVKTMIGLGLGPLLIGAISDALVASAGRHSLRYALLTAAVFNLWSAVHFFLAARTLRSELTAMLAPLQPAAP